MVSPASGLGDASPSCAASLSVPSVSLPVSVSVSASVSVPASASASGVAVASGIGSTSGSAASAAGSVVSVCTPSVCVSVSLPWQPIIKREHTATPVNTIANFFFITSPPKISTCLSAFFIIVFKCVKNVFTSFIFCEAVMMKILSSKTSFAGVRLKHVLRRNLLHAWNGRLCPLPRNHNRRYPGGKSCCLPK